MREKKFIKNVEAMIEPIEVGTIHFMQTYSKSIPKEFQYRVISKSAKNNPYMGFVVEPYSYFLCYEIIDIEWAKQAIPDGFELVKSKVFDEDTPRYLSIIGCFNVHASAFWGTRIEFYVIAKNIKTGLISWVIVDYDTNTVSYDRKNGLSASNTLKCVLTTNYDGEVLIDVKNFDNRKLEVVSDIKNGQTKNLCEKLWIEGNLSIGYGRKISKNCDDSFSTIFNPKEVEKALDIPLNDVKVITNNWFSGKISKNPVKVACFPYAQHYLSDSPGHYSQLTTKQDLYDKLDNLKFSEMSKYSSSALKTSFKVGQLVSLITIIILIILYITK